MTNILWVNMNFTGNLFFEFARSCGKVFPEPTDSHPFEHLQSQKMFFNIFLRWLFGNDSSNERVSAFLLCFIGFETINFYLFFWKTSSFGSNLLFQK